MNYNNPSEYTINRNIQQKLQKEALNLVSVLSYNNDDTSFNNLTLVARTIINRAITNQKEAGVLIFYFFQGLESKINDNTLMSPIDELKQTQENGKITKEAKELIMKTITEEQQLCFPMKIEDSFSFTKMLVEVSDQYDRDKILTFEWVEPHH